MSLPRCPRLLEPEIHRRLGWPLHKVVPEYLKPEKPEDIYHRGIGLYNLKEFPYTFEFSPDVEIKVNLETKDDEEITQVLLSARALNEGVKILELHLAKRLLA